MLRRNLLEQGILGTSFFTHVQSKFAAILEGFVPQRRIFIEGKMADKGSDSGEEEDPTIAEDVVVTKYKMAGDMANRKYK